MDPTEADVPTPLESWLEPVWNRLTSRQAAVIGAWTGRLIGPEQDVLDLVAELAGCPVSRHELALYAVAIRASLADELISVMRELGLRQVPPNDSLTRAWKRYRDF